jgi:hypothetical protein
MNHIPKTLIRASLVCGFAFSASAATVDGYLVDKMCSKKDPKTHERECALTPSCQKSGFVVVTPDGKLLSLDDKGNAEAIKALKVSKKADDLKVTVTGDVSGDSIKVASLKLAK